MTHVLIGGLVHDRPQVECYLRHLRELDTEGLEISWAFVLDGVDEPDWCDLWPEGARFLDGPPGPHWDRKALDKPACYAHLADLRNLLRAHALEVGADYLLSVDSDIIAPPDVLKRLLASGKPWVAGLVSNREPGQEDGRTFNVFKVKLSGPQPFLQHFQPMGTGAHGNPWPGPEGAGQDPRDTLVPSVPLCVGAVCLYQATLLRCATFAGHRWGEDIGFARQAFSAGYSGWYLPLRCEHLMTVEQLAEHRARCPLC